MSWAKFDDRYHDNRKVKRAWRKHRGTVGLHAMAVTYCAMHETDGVIDAEWIEEKLPVKRERDAILSALIEVGLLIERPDGDYEVHDYLEYNHSREQAEAQREARATRQAKWRERKRSASTDDDSNASTDASTGRHGDSAPTRPDPTRPDPVPPSPPSGGRERDHLRYGLEFNAWCATHFPGVEPKLVKFFVDRLERSRIEPTVEALSPMVEEYHRTEEAA